MILILLGAIVVLAHLFHYVRNQKFFKLNLPGPFAWPFIGNANRFLGGSNEAILNVMTFLTTNWPTPLRFWLGPKFFVLVTKPEDVQAVLTSQHCLNRDDVYDFTRTYAGDGLIALKNPAWKEHRRFLNPCFSLRILQSFMPIFNKEVKTMVERLKLQAKKGGTFDMYEYMDACTLDMVCQTTLGTEMNIQKNENVEFLYAGNKLLEIMTHRIFKPWYQLDFVYKMTKMYPEQKKCSKITYGFVGDIIKNKKKTFDVVQADEDASPMKDGSFKTPQIFIDQLLKLEGAHFNDWDMLSEASTVVAAGYETSALMISYAILMLAMHPEHQERVFEEVKLIFPDKNMDNFVNYEDLNNLEFTERIIKETMRLFPAVPVMARNATAPFDLNGIQIPTGTALVVGTISIHRDEKLWGPNAKKFDPDHFLPDNWEQKHPYSFIPFSAGPRNCIGFKYAMMSMKIAVAHAIRNFNFTTELKLEELRLEIDITLKLVNKHLVSATERAD